ncbi:hypothetical protein EDM00_04200 [Ornithobacterium rhinotracheale]|uniref:hypothetical protein n=1 Tax=Ornithobacterium rhinotracheale TaxID=28251 RepID=UPI00129C2692|nr:hypothetical protein [Ornithobacterium rhinotracheale]MRI63197.1 hypothetical protein [Ornithobacterium rhinotracheale]MRJ11281.1 hypothetical protein [Ornithobacterium rhinotracheale]
MNSIKHLFYALVFLSFLSCRNNHSYQEYDGIHWAEVEYFNPKTGSHNNYDLRVEVENNELIKIYFPNGGWLDDSHFEPEDISDGDCTITTDRGYEYYIKINN